MKIAVSTLGNTMDAKLDPRFGRAQGFLMVDTEQQTEMFVGNQENISLAQGAGIQTAQFMADSGVDVVVSGHFGPKAASVLERAGIRMVSAPEGITVREAVALAEGNNQAT